MAATWDNNRTVGPSQVALEITAEDDDGPFLSLVGEEYGLDLVITEDFEAQTFFDDVDRARAEWNRMKENS